MAEERTTQAAPDPLIEEFRAARVSLSNQFGNDVYRLGEYPAQVEAEHEARRAKALGREVSGRDDAPSARQANRSGSE